MHIRQVEVFPLALPMKQSFSISGGTVGDRNRGAPHVYVKLTDDDGHVGWGEARPSPRWSYETLESVVSTIEGYLAPLLIGRSVEDLRTIRQAMNRDIAGSTHPGQPIAKAAVDLALHDLLCKRRGLALPALWTAPFRESIRLSYLISTTDPEEAARKAERAAQEGYAGIDVKIGLAPSKDIDVLNAVRQAAGNLFLRVDANQAYDLGTASKIARHLERIGADVFEQPLPAGDLFGHRELRRKTNVPIALDESVWTPADVIRAVRMEACDAAVIKVTKMGGLAGAKLAGEIAAEAGLTLLGGGLTESRLGLAASGHLFQYLQIAHPVDLNGPMFLEDDPVEEGPTIEGGKVTLRPSPGIGCTISERKLQQYRKAPGS